MDGAVPTDATAADGAADRGPSASGPPSPVTGAQLFKWVNNQGEMDVVPNLTDTKVAAWSLSPDGQYTFIAGHGGPDGHFQVPAVPAGPFLLRVGGSYLASSEGRDFDLTTVIAGRPDRARTTRPMTVSLALDGLEPWRTGDRLVYYAPPVLGAELNVQGKLVPTLAAGATTAMGVVDYSTFSDPYLLDGPGRGDEVWLMQQTLGTSPQGQPYLVTRKAVSSKAVTLVDGQPASLTATMTDVPAAETLAVDWPVPDYQALAAAVSPVATIAGGEYFIWAAPNHDRFGDISWGAHLVYTTAAADTPAQKFSVAYGDPYPAGWGRIGGMYMRYQVPVMVPGASTPGLFIARIFVNDTAAKFGAGPVHPVVTPPRDPKINGRSAYGEVLGASATPLISWSPPTVGPPEVYKLFLYRARVAAGRVLFDPLATFWTEDTNLRIPPDVLQFGESYVLLLEALVEDGVSVTKPFNRAVHRGFAHTVTARFSP